MICINCDIHDVDVVLKEVRAPIPELREYEFIDIQFKCSNCGYDFNCVGAKTLNNSK
jgi:hypothetical protein